MSFDGSVTLGEGLNAQTGSIFLPFCLRERIARPSVKYEAHAFILPDIDALPAHSCLFLLAIDFVWKFPSLPLRSRLFQLPLKWILCKPAHIFPESNQLFVGHLAQFIPQLPQNFFV